MFRKIASYSYYYYCSYNMNCNKTIKGDTKDNTEGNDVCYKKYKKKRISNYYKVQDFE